MTALNSAANIHFGKSLISLFGVPGQMFVHGFQKTNDGSRTENIEVKKCLETGEVEKKLRAALEYNFAPWLHDPTVNLGFYQGMLALAEGLIVDETGTFYRTLADLFVDLFGRPKIYRGKILVDNHVYNLIIYESDLIPTTKHDLLVEF